MADSVDTILADAWTRCAPNRDQSQPFPRGFWPDVARAAVEYAIAGHITILDWQPTQCLRGSAPEPTRTGGKKSAGKISAAEKAANTAALLASLKGPS